MAGRLFEHPEKIETVEGILERITFANAENAWSVVRIVVPGRNDPITAVGSLLGVQPGESLRLTGRWITDRKYGEQFKVDSYVTVAPSTLRGIRKYLGSGLVPGIGEVMAERLVRKFGLETLDVIEGSPERLAEVEGIGPVRSAKIREAWAEQRGIRDVMIFLQAQGITTNLAVKVFKTYGNRAIAVVKEDPYRLAVDVFGVGFKTADRIAAGLGIPKDSPRRAVAGVLHVLGETVEEGNVYFPRDRLRQRAAELLEVGEPVVDTAIEALRESGAIVLDEEPQTLLDGQPGGSAHSPAEEPAAYTKSLYLAEQGVAGSLARILATPVRPVTIDVERALAWFEERNGIRLAPLQRDALRLAIAEKVLVITGGPGTGKTTLVRAITSILEKKQRRILMAAPTGRAAKRMQAATGREARTVHRLLEFNPKSGEFQRNPSRPLEADLVIIDEASMLDLPLSWSLVRALPPAAQLILVGDVDQIPSVGPGTVLSDIIRSASVALVRLNEIFRQAQSSRIVVNAHRVNRGEMPILAKDEGSEGAGAAASAVSKAASGPEDFFFVERDDPEAVLTAIRSLVGDRIPRRFGFDPREEIQVLTPMHKGLLGASNLNVELQALLNPSSDALTRGSRSLRTGDKVMQIRNNYDLEVFNGDIGRIEAIGGETHEVLVRYDDRRIVYKESDLDELVLAYACSIHKAQGSEYPCVVVPIHTQHYVMLQRNLLYTAMTRGKRLVVLVGSKRALAIAVRNADVAERFTKLALRLTRFASPPPSDAVAPQ